MQVRWRLVLCLWGLSLFGLQTYGSMSGARVSKHQGRYFWWGSIRLDSAPLTLPSATRPCADESGETCVEFDPEFIWVRPGWIERVLILSAFPAFLVTLPVVHGLAHLGVSELLSFMITMPLMILLWFFLVGWLLDRRRYKRSLRRTQVGQ